MPLLSEYLPPRRFTSSSTAPSNPTRGDIWLDEDTGVLYTYYTDSGGSQWVEFGSASTGETGATGPQGPSGPTGPTGPILSSIPQNAKSSNYTLIASDAGKHISITSGGVNVPSGVFSVGDTVTIYNNSSSPQTVFQGSSVTLRFGGTTATGNRTVASYGICTLLCVAANVFVISGAGLT